VTTGPDSPGAPALRARVQAGEALLGVFLGWPAGGIIELAALAGFDFAVIDSEHGIHGIESIENLLRAADAAAIPAIVRSPSCGSELVGRCLDVGASGVLFPRADGVRAARLAVSSVKFSPDGRRGLGGVRANRYGATPLDRYVVEANETTLTAIQIETSGALEELAEIAEERWVDVLFVGPNDLSLALGIPGNTRDPRYRDALEKIVGAAAAAGKTPGIMVGAREQIPALREMGFRFFTTSDRALLLESARAWRAAVAGTRRP
jgi:4-hydroxy-2-oxoheptanedioate aldolase